MTEDKKYLLSKGWTVARERWSGYVKQVCWKDPVDGRECYQSLAIYIQEKRDRVAETEQKEQQQS